MDIASWRTVAEVKVAALRAVVYLRMGGDYPGNSCPNSIAEELA
jgi:hypothetical protein